MAENKRTKLSSVFNSIFLVSNITELEPNGDVAPVMGSPTPEEIPELKVYTPDQQAEIDTILQGEGRGFFFDGEDNVYIEKGWSITVPDYEGRESISYGGLILTNPEFSEDAYYLATEDMPNAPTLKEWKAQKIGLAPSPEGTPNPLDLMQEALEALRAGKPIPESNPLAKSGLSIQALETQIDEILAASEGRKILNNSVSGNIPNGEVDPLTGSPAPEELPELKVYTPEQQAEIDKILDGEGRGFFFDGEDNVYIEKGWSITVPDYEGRESISYGGLILTNPEFSQDAYYLATEDMPNAPTFEEWKAQQLI